VNPDKIPSIGGSPNAIANTQAANAAKLEKILAAQKIQIADQRFQQKIQQRTAQMLTAANMALQEWKAAPAQAYTEGTVKENSPANASSANVTAAGLAASPGLITH
jgi:intracellular multiplication protein IcmE